MIVFVFIWVLGANWIAIQRKFYRLQAQESPASVTGLQLLGAFAFYAFFALAVPLLLIFLFKHFLPLNEPSTLSLPTPLLTFIHFGVRLALFICLIWFFHEQNPGTLKKLWKNKFHHPTRSRFYDFGLGVLAWFLSFPLVSIIAEGIDQLMKYFFHYEYVAQNAVKFVKLAIDSPTSLILVLLSILVLAPLVEEFLFRGILQTYLKKWTGRGWAIAIAAFSFALFHFSTAQGLANISLIVPLFILGGFLGFLYERQGSLWAPIGLHATFNLITALRIILLQETV